MADNLKGISTRHIVSNYFVGQELNKTNGKVWDEVMRSFKPTNKVAAQMAGGDDFITVDEAQAYAQREDLTAAQKAICSAIQVAIEEEEKEANREPLTAKQVIGLVALGAAAATGPVGLGAGLLAGGVMAGGVVAIKSDEP